MQHSLVEYNEPTSTNTSTTKRVITLVKPTDDVLMTRRPYDIQSDDDLPSSGWTFEFKVEGCIEVEA